MPATVLHMSDHRAVFLMAERGGTVVFLASRGPTPRIAHERLFESAADASAYAGDLSTTYGCSIIGAHHCRPNGEDAANG